jgi:hypothetical protein
MPTPMPLTLGLAASRCGHTCTVMDVLQNLLLLRVVLGPRVWLERIAVHHTLDVTRTAWVAIGTPLQGKGDT